MCIHISLEAWGFLLHLFLLKSLAWVTYLNLKAHASSADFPWGTNQCNLQRVKWSRANMPYYHFWSLFLFYLHTHTFVLPLCFFFALGMSARETERPSLRPEGCVSHLRANFSCESVWCVHSCHESDRRSVQDNPLSSLLRVCSSISIGDILDTRREFEKGADSLRVTATAAVTLWEDALIRSAVKLLTVPLRQN